MVESHSARFMYKGKFAPTIYNGIISLTCVLDSHTSGKIMYMLKSIIT